MRTVYKLKPKELAEIEKAIRQDKRAEVKQRATDCVSGSGWDLDSLSIAKHSRLHPEGAKGEALFRVVAVGRAWTLLGSRKKTRGQKTTCLHRAEGTGENGDESHLSSAHFVSPRRASSEAIPHLDSVTFYLGTKSVLFIPE